jgi:hypothetical protein
MGTSKVMTTGLISGDTVYPNDTFTQDDSIGFARSDLKKPAQNLRRRKQPAQPVVHIDKPRSHNGQKVVDKMGHNHMRGVDHPKNSPDLSPSDF